MKPLFKGIGIFLLTIVFFLLVGQGVGWFNVFSTRTLGKAQQNAETEVYYETQAFTTAKKQAALKYYREFSKAPDDEKQALRILISQEFADFDETKLDYNLQEFIRSCKYN